jgi:hypothetical protein
MRLAAAVTLFLQMFIAFAPAYAEQVIEPDKRALILKLMELTDARRNSIQMAKIVANQIFAALRTQKPEMPEKMSNIVVEETMALIDDELDNILEAIIPIYARHFTNSELRDLIAFYTTATGQKAISKMPLILQETAPAVQSTIQMAIPKMQRRMLQRLKDAGYVTDQNRG